jgi:mono/diheme cytochrome c family protein
MKKLQNQPSTIMIKISALVSSGLVILLCLQQSPVSQPLKTTIDRTPNCLARGKYIFTLAHCDVCHSARDFSRFDGPVMSGGIGAGLVLPPRLSGRDIITGPNITPDVETGIGTWTDGEKIRAIREGIGPHNHMLMPIMPYQNFRILSDADAYSLVAYLDELPAVRHFVPRSSVSFKTWLWMTCFLILNSAQHHTLDSPPDVSDRLKYGRYLVTIGQCMRCHGKDLSGGEEFREARDTVVVSANISPDPETGIGLWTEQDFRKRVYRYSEYVVHGAPIVAPDRQTPMPWLSLSQISARDLTSIYLYLRSRPAVSTPIGARPLRRRRE